MTCDIIIPVWDRLQLTQQCIDSIIQHTASSSYRLIIIDNHSNKETEDYLRGLKKQASFDLVLIRNEENLGFVKAVNQGVRSSQGEYICLLNNDTQVQEGWLEELIKVAKSNPQIGIVNPGGDNMLYKKGQPLSGKWVEIGFASGFCMLIKREVIDRVGLLDEAYRTGFWEETDYCQRAKKSGYICAAAKGAYVYHLGHKTFESFDKERVSDLFERNKELFVSRWGKILQIAYVIFKKNIGPNEASTMLKFARDGHMVYLFLKSSARIENGIEHGSIRKFKTPDWWFYIHASGKILIRHTGKKGYNKIFTDNPGFARLLKFCNRNLQVAVI